jgi:hypothetical protein
MASLIVILVVIPLVLHGYAGRVEAGAGDVPDKVHRIRKAQMAAILALPVLEVIFARRSLRRRPFADTPPWGESASAT